MTHRVVAALVVLGILAMPVAAALVRGPANGHCPERLGTVVTWSGAEAAAPASSYTGQSDFLAALTSEAENAFISHTLLNGASGFTCRIGACQFAGSRQPDRNRQSVGSDRFSDGNWDVGWGPEFSINGGNEDSLEILTDAHEVVFPGGRMDSA